MGSQDKLKVGELARRTGLTVRTLHHWDELGLLTPGERTAAGYRLYGAPELERLQQVLSLRRLGMPLGEIATILRRREMTPQRILSLQLSRLREESRSLQRLIARLQRLIAHYEGTETVSVDELVQSIEEMTMFERYYTEEQLERLARRREAVGEETIRSVEERWSALTTRVQNAIDRGVDPGSEEGRELAREWRELTEETVRGFTGSDPGLEASLGAFWKNEPDAGGRWGMGRDVLEWIGRAGD